jgi:mRNA interferase MazF
MNDKFISQKHIYMCELDGIGSEQRGVRPVLVVSNNINNQFSNVVTIVPLTSKIKNSLPVHYYLYQSKYTHLLCPISTVLCEQIRTIDKIRIGDFIEKIDMDDFNYIISTINENFKIYK